MKRFLCVLMALMLSVLALSSCSISTEEHTDNQSLSEEVATPAPPTDDEITASIVGKWTGELDGSRIGYQFNSDGTGFATLFPMTYTVKNGVVTITVSGLGKTETGSATYSADSDTLILSQGKDTFVLSRYTE